MESLWTPTMWGTGSLLVKSGAPTKNPEKILSPASVRILPMSKQVMCIKKRPSHYDRHHRIEAIGGVVNGVRWKRAEDDAIKDVKADPQAYYTSVNNKSVWVVIATHNGREYLKTQAD